MIKGQIDVVWKGDEAIKDVEKACSQVLDIACDPIIQKAKDNTSPGRGPGPHPHISHHYDTGALMADIQKGEEYQEGMTLVREIGNTEATYYGSILEIGWHSRAGNWFRYPWLWVSLELSVGEIRQLVGAMKL